MLLLSVSALWQYHTAQTKSVVEGGWIDPDTDNSVHAVASYIDGRKHSLVFSDEFNTNGRSFHDGNDPRWTAINKDDYTNYALHYYNHDLAQTSNGFLNISTIIKDIHYTFEDVVNGNPKETKTTKNYQSAMLQGWNKFCFTGGIVEISARLPGQAYIGGLWPAMWMMGNLARATYVGSSNNIWPWSYNTCSKGQAQHQQWFSACNSATHWGMLPHQGRGAPEVDILEAMPGKEVLVGTSTQKPYFSASYQVAPGKKDGYRPNPGETPVPELWYSPDFLEYGPNTSLNIFFYGMHLAGVTPDRDYTADALSANRNLEPSHFEEQHVYRVEWVQGPEGYLQWHLDGELVYHISAAAMNSTGAIIPEEPMYLLFNTAVSSTWGFPSPCPEDCPCDCFDCRDPACACAVPAGMCSNLPAHMLIDYVRVYQAIGDSNQTVGCSTATHPTAKYIEAHADVYKTKHDALPLKKVPHGGGSCTAHSECGGDLLTPRPGHSPASAIGTGTGVAAGAEGGAAVLLLGRGECIQHKCRCYADLYTGPHCLAYQGYNDIDWNPEPELTISWLVLPRSLLVLVSLAVLVLIAVAAWKHQQGMIDRAGSGRPGYTHAYEPIP